jgi:hypothetical protein
MSNNSESDDFVGTGNGVEYAPVQSGGKKRKKKGKTLKKKTGRKMKKNKSMKRKTTKKTKKHKKKRR